MTLRPRLIRFGISGVGGFMVALSLLWVMQLLVMNDADVQQAKEDRPAFEFLRLKHNDETRLKKRKLPEQPPEPETPPQLPELKMAAIKPAFKSPDIPLNMPDMGFSFDMGTTQSREFMAISRIPPRYPYRAERKGIEGWVKVSFEITGQGLVKDVVVIDAKPSGVFDSAAIQAVLKWRFKPRIINGQPVSVRAEQMVDFHLNRGR